MLLKAQRNELLQILQKHNIPPQLIIEDKQQASYTLKVQEEFYYFKISPMRQSPLGGDFDLDALPKVREAQWGEGNSWTEVEDRFAEWARDISTDLETPDLWAEAAKTAQLFAPTAEPSDDKFTRIELAEVQGQLRLLQLSIIHAALPETAKQKLIQLTETAAVKAEGLTKKDWQNWIIGGLISAIIGLALNPTQAGEVLKLVKAAFGGLFLH